MLVPDTCSAASREREIDGLEVKFGRCQTNIGQYLFTSVHTKLNLTFIAVASTGATQRIYPLLFGDTELASEVDGRQDAGSGQIDVVEGVHQQRI